MNCCNSRITLDTTTDDQVGFVTPLSTSKSRTSEGANRLWDVLLNLDAHHPRPVISFVAGEDGTDNYGGDLPLMPDLSDMSPRALTLIPRTTIRRGQHHNDNVIARQYQQHGRPISSPIPTIVRSTKWWDSEPDLASSPRCIWYQDSFMVDDQDYGVVNDGEDGVTTTSMTTSQAGGIKTWQRMGPLRPRAMDRTVSANETTDGNEETISPVGDGHDRSFHHHASCSLHRTLSFDDDDDDGDDENNDMGRNSDMDAVEQTVQQQNGDQKRGLGGLVPPSLPSLPCLSFGKVNRVSSAPILKEASRMNHLTTQ